MQHYQEMYSFFFLSLFGILFSVVFWPTQEIPFQLLVLIVIHSTSKTGSTRCLFLFEPCMKMQLSFVNDGFAFSFLVLLELLLWNLYHAIGMATRAAVCFLLEKAGKASLKLILRIIYVLTLVHTSALGIFLLFCRI